MKTMKRLASLLLALTLVFAFAATASAEDTTFNITAPATNHQYEIYQIFTGTYEDGKLNDVQWGANGTTKTGPVDSSVLQGIQEKTAESDILAAVKACVDFGSTPVATITNGGSYAAVPGYYLIKDQDGSVSGSDAYTLYVVNVVNENITIAPKTGIPVMVKKVKDTNDTTSVTSGWQDSADYDIGDTIPYQLTATMGDLSRYDHYYVEFVDTMTHLTYTGITSVKVGDTTLTSEQYQATWDNTTKTLKVIITDVKAYGAVTGTAVVVEYTATLDADAVIGSAGNPNEAYLIFTNNPNNTGDGTSKPSDTGETPKDKNIVFTYKVIANKVTTDDKALKGAAFELFKKNSAGEWVSLGVKGATKNGDNKYTVDENTTTFEWKGIDDGDYKIVEVVTPEGYNTIEPIEFTVTATHDETADNPALRTLTGGNLFTGNVSTGAVSANIVNKTGSTLPETGGIGTTIFYVIGGILVAAAVVLLVTRKRVNGAE